MKAPPELPIDPPSERDFDAEEDAREADGEFRYECRKNGDDEHERNPVKAGGETDGTDSQHQTRLLSE